MLSVLTFRALDEAVVKANNTAYGLSAGVWTEKGSHILWMAPKRRAGVVWANTYDRFDRPARSAATGSWDSDGRAAGTGSPHTSMPDSMKERHDAGTARPLTAAWGCGRLQAVCRRRVPAFGIKTLLPGACRQGRGAAGLGRADLAQRRADAVVTARKAVSKWSGATAYDRGPVLYRVAEMTKGRAVRRASRF